MAESAEGLAGQILRAWREHAGRSGAEVARAMHVTPPAVSNWEKGARGRRTAEFLDMVESYAAALGLSVHESRALTETWRAAGSPRVTPPRIEWAYNFPGAPGPVWAWIRTRDLAEPFIGAVQWGPFHARLDARALANGVIVQTPTSVPNPPLTVTLAGPGWVDFGRGHVPPDVARRLGIGYIRSGMFTGPDTVWAETSHLADSDYRILLPSINEATQLARLLGMRWVFGRNRSPRHALDEAEIEATFGSGPSVLDTGGLVSQLLVTAAKAQDIREARGMSRATAADLATRHEPSNPVSAKMIEGLEDGGRIPSPPRALTRLDMAYRMDGRFGIDRTYDSGFHDGSTGVHDITFANYWRGPVWIQARNADPLALCTVELTWGPWRRRQRVQSGGVLTTRKATNDAPPLRVRVPVGWRVVAGLGAIPTALDINQGWYPHDIATAMSLIRRGIRSVRESLRSNPAPILGES